MDFLRFAEVTIGPLADWQGRGDPSQAVVVRADGSASRLRVAFTSVKTLTGDPNKTDVTIYGLSRDLRQAMRTKLTRVQIVAGYSSDATSAAIVATGAIVASVAQRQDADITTKLSILDGFGGMIRGATARSYTGVTSLAQVVKETAAAMPGVEVPDVLRITGRLPPKGVHLAGTSAQQLNKLADQHGFSWSVQNGVFQAVPDNGHTGDQFSFSTSANLISCVPLLDGPTQAEVGVEVVAKFEARIKPGDLLTVQSDISPQLSGTYKASQVTLQFDSHGPAQVVIQGTKL